MSVTITYSRGLNLSYNRACEQNNGQETTNTVQFFDSGIIVTNNFTGNKINYNYSVVKRVISNKKLIMLLTKAKIVIAVEKAEFTVGNSEELIAFVDSKLKTFQNA